MADTAGGVIITVTGDVGAGKSTFSRILEEAGCVRLDADAVAIEMWSRPDVLAAVEDRWGPSVLDGAGVEINRAAAADRMFSSPEEYDWACGMLHPLVMEELGRRVRNCTASGERAVVEVPLLFEACRRGGRKRPDWAGTVVFVTAPRDIRLRRCAERGWDEAELSRREAFYIPPEERMRLSDIIVDSNCSLEDLREKAIRLIKN